MGVFEEDPMILINLFSILFYYNLSLLLRAYSS